MPGITFLNTHMELVKDARFIRDRVVPYIHPGAEVPAIVVPVLDNRHNVTEHIVHGVTIGEYYIAAHRSSGNPNLVAIQKGRLEKHRAALEPLGPSLN